MSLLKRKLQEVPEGQKETFAQLFITSYIKEALSGKGDMLRDAFDRVDGKARQPIDGKLTNDITLHVLNYGNHNSLSLPSPQVSTPALESDGQWSETGSVRLASKKRKRQNTH